MLALPSESISFVSDLTKWSEQYDLICDQNSVLYKTHIEPKRTKGNYMSSDRCFWCGSEFLSFDSPQFPTGVSILKKYDCLTKIFQFFQWYYLRLSQKGLFSTFWFKNDHSNKTSHVILACIFLLLLSFMLKLCTKFKFVITFWCNLNVFELFFNFDKYGFQGVGPTVEKFPLSAKHARRDSIKSTV